MNHILSGLTSTLVFTLLVTSTPTNADYNIRKEQNQKLGTAYEVAKRCSDFELNTASMATSYCTRLFMKAIESANIITGCETVSIDAIFLIRQELRSIWFFDRKPFFSLVEQVLQDNFQCGD